LPASATPDAARLVTARMMRAFADGLVSVLLPAYLTLLGYTAAQIGGLVTATLLGSAVLTLAVGFYAQRFRTRLLLLAACGLMFVTGLGFTFAQSLPVLLLVAIVGTLNPTAGDVSVFLPLEQSLLASEAQPAELPALYARSNVAAAMLASLGALCTALPEPVARASGLSLTDAMRLSFLFYGLTGLLAGLLYTRLARRPAPAATPDGQVARAPLVKSRRIVLQLSTLFTLDSFGGGFVVQSLLALWLFQRFAFTLADAAGFFFAATLISGCSQLLSPVLARRFGLIPTMVFTHMPANAFLIGAAFMPTAGLAVTLLLLRMVFSSMDVPARQAFVMSAVSPEERAAAAAVTNVPRSLGTGLAPLIAGVLLANSSFGWPLVIAGGLKLLYDALLLLGYRHHAASKLA
jgi:MFS family permease